MTECQSGKKFSDLPAWFVLDFLIYIFIIKNILNLGYSVYVNYEQQVVAYESHALMIWSF